MVAVEGVGVETAPSFSVVKITEESVGSDGPAVEAVVTLPVGLGPKKE